MRSITKNALKPSLEYIDDMQDRLQLAVKLFQLRQECIIKEEQRMAKLISQTGGFYLTSIPGVSIVLAAYIMAEYGIAWIEIETQRMFKKWEAYNVYPSDDNKLGEWRRKKDKIIKVLTNT